MEVSQMNKTAILSFIVDEVALKCRNVSSNMRKRIHCMLKEREIIVRKYDKRALVLNGWVRIGRTNTTTPEIEEMKKGISNYLPYTQEQLDNLKTLNNEIRCYELNFSPNVPIEVESIEKLEISPSNYESFSEFSSSKTKFLLLERLSTEQIKLILTRFKTIEKLEIQYSSLESIDFSSFKIKEFVFSDVAFKEQVNLPKEIEKLSFSDCKLVNLVKAQRVNEIDFFDSKINPTEFKELAETLKGVRAVGVNSSFELTSLPSTVRKICTSEANKELANLEAIVKKLPHLIEIHLPLPIEALEKTKLRAINPKMSQTEQIFKLRPREITVTPENATQLNNHPELFEKVESVVIYTYEFNFDVLPKGIKKITICCDVDDESFTLTGFKRNVNRFEKARFDVSIWNYSQVEKILACLNKGTRVSLRESCTFMIKDFPDLKITI